jgi:anaerobic ribonucleoside-triphosphate reductase
MEREMATVVIKRDGCRTGFDAQRIEQAVAAAARAAEVEDAAWCAQVAERVALRLADCPEVDIREIQCAVEETLMAGPYPQLARAYIEYRHDRDVARDRQSQLHHAIRGLVDQTNAALLNENANKDSKVIPTQRDLLAGIVAKHYAQQQILPRDVVLAHERGEIHYHDLDYSPFFPMFNCMLIDLKGMLTNGFKMGNAEIEPPKSIATATAVTAQIIAQVASHIYGGTTINRIDEVLAPFVEQSYARHLAIAEQWQIPQAEQYARQRTEKECYDAFQSLEYEVNTLHTANGQTPFVTFGFGLGTDWAARLIQQSILLNRLAGLGKNRKTAVFPKLVFSIREGVNRRAGDVNYDIKQLALECASKRMYPDILNYDQVVKVTGSFKTPMGCRSFLGVYEENGEQIHEGRNNIGVISLNLPRIALEAGGDEARFWTLLDARLLLAKRALMTRVARLEKTKARVAPILYMEGACGVRLNADDEVGPIFRNGRASLSLGYIGLHETLNALSGGHQHPYDDAALRAKGVEIIAYMRDATERWKAETGYGFSLYSTPSENLWRSLVWCQALPTRATTPTASISTLRRRSILTTKSTLKRPIRRWRMADSSVTANTRMCSTTSRRWRMSGITATTACPITALIPRLMSATSAASTASSPVPAAASPVRIAATTIRRASPLPGGSAAIWAARMRGPLMPVNSRKCSVG